MKTFVWLIVTGVVWLALIQTSKHLGYPPQLVTLARTGYIGTFAIFMMIELRRSTTNAVASRGFQGLHASEFGWYLIPLISLGVLGVFSTDLVITPLELATTSVFYICQLALLIIRNRLAQMRTAAWDLVPPVLLAALLLNPYVVLVAAVVVLSFIGWMLVRGGSDEHGAADSLVMQLPSLCLAPVIPIALRDVFDFGGTVDRADVETFGMIVNGVGAAVWTAVVMKSSDRMAKYAIVLWAIGTVVAFALLAVPGAVWISAAAIPIAELFRGSLWLATTHLLMSTSRWTGFAVNLLATGVPFLSLWLARSSVGPETVMTVYAAFHVAVPLGLWMWSRMQR